MKKHIVLYLILGLLLSACTDFQVLAPISPKGNKGERGISAYEEWLSLLDKGLYPYWNGGRTEIDYMKFLAGPDGKDGMDAYEVWKDMISKGGVKDPHNPGQVWPPTKDSVRDFFRFLTGEKGTKGDQGEKGEKGNTGDKGAQGDKGDRGDKGAQGDKGDRGDKGAQGDKGDTGDKGAKGDKGDTGDKGAKGDKGDRGDKGDLGDPGAPGKKGPNGPDGPNGKQGEDGINGINGISAYEIWKKEAEKGTLPNPHPNLPGYEGPTWPKDKVTEDDFRVYLNGQDRVIQPEIRVNGEKVTTAPGEINPTLADIIDARIQRMTITIIAPVGEPRLEIVSMGEDLATKYLIAAVGKAEKDGVTTYAYELTTPHNIGPDRTFKLVVSNALKADQPHNISVKHKGYLTPLEYMAEFNMDKTGDNFATSHSNAASGLFKQTDAIAKYEFKAKFMIDGVHYYMPDIYTWRSIFPSDDAAMKFAGGTTVIDNKKEDIRLNTHEIKNIFTADYRSTEGRGYGLRLKSDDNRLRTAFRYEYIDNPVDPQDGSLPFIKALKVTSRFLGPDQPGKTITIDTINDEAFWAQNTDSDIVRIFPASGILDNAGVPVPLKYGESGYYWSTTINKTKTYGLRMIFHRWAVDASNHVNPSSYSSAVRLFRQF